jgi:hypothetical protein
MVPGERKCDPPRQHYSFFRWREIFSSYIAFPPPWRLAGWFNLSVGRQWHLNVSSHKPSQLTINGTRTSGEPCVELSFQQMNADDSVALVARES